MFPGTVASNHSNLYNKLIALVQGRLGVIHAEVNGKGERLGERNGTTSGSGWRGRDGTGDMGEGRIRRVCERGIESSVPVASILGLEHHHPIMSKLWGHGGRPKRKRKINKTMFPGLD